MIQKHKLHNFSSWARREADKQLKEEAPGPIEVSLLKTETTLGAAGAILRLARIASHFDTFPESIRIDYGVQISRKEGQWRVVSSNPVRGSVFRNLELAPLVLEAMGLPLSDAAMIRLNAFRSWESETLAEDLNLTSETIPRHVLVASLALGDKTGEVLHIHGPDAFEKWIEAVDSLGISYTETSLPGGQLPLMDLVERLDQRGALALIKHHRSVDEEVNGVSAMDIAIRRQQGLVFSLMEATTGKIETSRSGRSPLRRIVEALDKPPNGATTLLINNIIAAGEDPSEPGPDGLSAIDAANAKMEFSAADPEAWSDRDPVKTGRALLDIFEGRQLTP